mmetsp:Transcript_29490/g.44805  ORF Transcript_29490/g.44805 Transcript_29490/m.44805 type:complete len:82 (-) Transcript_29490:8438-8683(-)
MDHGHTYDSVSKKQPKIASRHYEPPSISSSLNNDNSFKYMKHMEKKYPKTLDERFKPESNSSGMNYDPTLPSFSNVDTIAP